MDTDLWSFITDVVTWWVLYAVVYMVIRRYVHYVSPEESKFPGVYLKLWDKDYRIIKADESD